MLIGCMLWRIGEALDLFEQIVWAREHAFEAVAFWTCAGRAGEWQGFDAARATPAETERLRAALGPFACVDLHAAVALTEGTLPELLRAVAFAGELGAATVTLHIDEAGPGALLALHEAAEAAGVQIGLELTRDYELAMREATPRIGLTLDVGHVSFEGGAGYREF
ncbi:MAG: hypothetical protein FJX74_24365, partial [Armatimonadetes bacterium]|nr:hypothetical protein [Armatimonadota bacterium]